MHSYAFMKSRWGSAVLQTNKQIKDLNSLEGLMVLRLTQTKQDKTNSLEG